VICNNLGGFGPEKNAPQQLHYRAVAHLHGHAVDVVRPWDRGSQGRDGGDGGGGQKW